MTKTCPRCGEDKPLDAFYVQRSGRVSSWCKACQIARSSERYRADPEGQRAYMAAYYQRNKDKYADAYRRLRQQVLDAYGNVCACCGETTPEFLAVDHVNNDGESHRRELEGHGQNIYTWLRMQGFPQDGRFQLLCHNCNIAKGLYGGCPHQGEVPGRRVGTREWAA